MGYKRRGGPDSERTQKNPTLQDESGGIWTGWSLKFKRCEMSSKGNKWCSGSRSFFFPFAHCSCYICGWAKVAQKIKIRTQIWYINPKSPPFPNRWFTKENMLSIYPMNRTTLIYKSENKRKQVIWSIVPNAQTQTYIHRLLCGWQLCKHLLSLPVLGSWDEMSLLKG